MEVILTYRARWNNTEWTPFEIAEQHPNVTRVEMSSSSEGVLTIRFFLSGIASAQDARVFSDGIAGQIVNRLSFEQGTFISEPVFVSSGLEYVENGRKVYEENASVRGGAYGSTQDVFVPGPLAVDAVKKGMERSTWAGETHYERFRLALGQKDEVAKFLELYLILASFFRRDNQGEIDKHIWDYDPLVPSSNNPITGKPETVYTRLRNQVGHNRDKTSEETRKEMGQHMNGLIGIVRRTIKEKS